MIAQDENEKLFKVVINNQYIRTVVNSCINKSNIQNLNKQNSIIDEQDLFQQSILALIEVLNKTTYSDEPYYEQKIWDLVSSLGHEESWIHWNPEIEEYTSEIKKKFASILSNRLRDYFNKNRVLSGRSKNHEDNYEYISLEAIQEKGMPEPYCTIDGQLEGATQDYFYRNSEFGKFFLERLNEKNYFKPKQKETLEKLMENDHVQAAAARERGIDRSTVNKSVRAIQNKVLKDFIKEYGLQYGIDYITDDEHKYGDYIIICDERKLSYIREKKEITKFLNGRPKRSDIVHFIHDNFHQFWIQRIINKLDKNMAMYFIKNFVQMMDYRLIKDQRTQPIIEIVKKEIEARLEFINDYLSKSQIAI